LLSSSRLLRNVDWRLIIVALAIGLGGCGGEAAVKTGTSNHARSAQAVPAYRVGQYCVLSREAKYRAAGLTCTRHHLEKR
jgi:hypothetical protein